MLKEHPGSYDRDLFPLWRDVDGDGCETRDQVLTRDSSSPTQVDGYGCNVLSGNWTSPYDGARWTSPSDVDIDHVVALKETWDSGGWQWDEARRTAYANDTSDDRTLVAVTDSVNQSKGDKDPSNWLPPQPADECRFIGDWIAIKARWELTMDPSEFGRLRNLLRRDCPGLTVAPWPPVPTLAPRPTAPSPTTIGSTAAAPPLAASVSYANCDAARAAGAAPLHQGQPGYRPEMDGDGDGIACEA